MRKLDQCCSRLGRGYRRRCYLWSPQRALSLSVFDRSSVLPLVICSFVLRPSASQKRHSQMSFCQIVSSITSADTRRGIFSNNPRMFSSHQLSRKTVLCVKSYITIYAYSYVYAATERPFRPSTYPVFILRSHNAMLFVVTGICW